MDELVFLNHPILPNNKMQWEIMRISFTYEINNVSCMILYKSFSLTV